MHERVMPCSQGTSRAHKSASGWTPARVAILALGVALVVAFVARAGVSDVVAELRRAGAKALWLFVPYAAGTALGAFPWGALLPRGVRPPPLALIQSRFAASSANSLLPFFGSAGEPSRLLWLSQRARARGLAAVAVDRLLYNSANGVLLLAGALVAMLATPLPNALAWTAFGVGLLTLGATPLGFFLVARFGVGAKVQKLLGPLLGQKARSSEFGHCVDAELLSILREPERPLWTGAALHLAGRVVLAAEIPVGLWALGADYGPSQALVLAVVPIALSLVFSSVPGQLGIQEGAQALMAPMLGLSPALVLSLVLLQRFRQLAFAALLPLLLSRARSSRPVLSGGTAAPSRPALPRRSSARSRKLRCPARRFRWPRR
jgi:hypothetical protein